jgi:transglutaminase-like putative cysteine protease
MSQRLQNLTGRFNGLDSKIKFIKGCYTKSFFEPIVRRTAEVWAGRGSRLEQVASLYRNIKASVAYLPDPVGVEMTKSPAVILREVEARGQSAGDCDDHACLGYTMLKSIGIPASIRVAWFDTIMPQHIYIRAFVSDRWLAFDTTNKKGIGMESPDISKVEDF